MEINVNKWKVATILLALALVSTLAYTFAYPMLVNYCMRMGTQATLDNIVDQIKMRNSAITIDTGGDILVCNILLNITS